MHKPGSVTRGDVIGINYVMSWLIWWHKGVERRIFHALERFSLHALEHFHLFISKDKRDQFLRQDQTFIRPTFNSDHDVIHFRMRSNCNIAW